MAAWEGKEKQQHLTGIDALNPGGNLISSARRLSVAL